MSHLSSRKYSAVARTPADWLPVAAQVSRLASRVSTRMDVVANIGPGIGGPYGTACWSPRSADLEINTDRCLPGRNPLDVNIDSEAFCLSALPFVGAVVHESAHARYTRWVPIDLLNLGFSKAECDVTIALEESRIERRIAHALPVYKPALTQVALDVVLRDFRVSETPYGASISAALTLARYDAGLLSSDEADRFREPLVAVLGEDALSTLRALWIKYQTLDQGECHSTSSVPFEQMQDIAAEWLNVVRALTSKRPEPDAETTTHRPKGEGTGEGESLGESGESGEGAGESTGESGESAGESGESAGESAGSGRRESSGEGEGESTGESPATTEATGTGSGIPDEDEGAEPAFQPHDADDDDDGDKDKEGHETLSPTERAIRALAGDMSVQREADALDDAAKRRAEENVAAHKAEMQRRRTVARRAKTLLRDPETTCTPSCHAPSAADRAAANDVRRHLERVIYRDMAVVKRDHALPGGRLRAARAVQQAAVAARGGRDRIPVWRSKERHRCDETPITVGIMIDVSGSMGGNMQGAAAITYALSQAVTTLDGKVSSVAFGCDARYIARSTTPLRQVPILHAVDGWENFSDGLALLDNDLHLFDQRGARILVVFSDGVFVRDEEAAAAKNFMATCRQERIVVIWASTDLVTRTHGYGIVLENLPHNPQAMLQTVGQTILAAVTRIDQANR